VTHPSKTNRVTPRVAAESTAAEAVARIAKAEEILKLALRSTEVEELKRRVAVLEARRQKKQRRTR
jgi:hypothetical protein